VSSDNTTGTPRPFDAKMVEYLVGLMAQHDLNEIDLHEGEQRIRLRRGVLTAPATMTGYPMAAPPTAAAAPPAPMNTAAQPTAEPAAATRNLHEIKSPMVGTFYSKPAPDKPDYVSVGSRVTPDTVVCKVEAMKIFNDLTADCSGVIVEVCVKNGQPVDFGTVLFRVEPA
jgi:acetyl-CoA carboxylase biotin carboxyl carrier protein